VRVMPAGENICRFCARPFVAKGRLDSHLRRKHRREMQGLRA
jgi:hypothetical protein